MSWWRALFGWWKKAAPVGEPAALDAPPGSPGASAAPGAAAKGVVGLHGKVHTADTIVPLLRCDPVRQGEMAERTLVLAGNDAPILEPWLGDLNVGYAYDAAEHFQYVRVGDLAALGVKREELRALAVRNLLARLPPIQSHSGDSLAMITAGGNFEISLLLAPEVWRQVGGGADLYVAAPARDLLFWIPVDRPSAYDAIAGMVAKVHADPAITRKQSALVFLWAGGRFRVAEAPGEAS